MIGQQATLLLTSDWCSEDTGELDTEAIFNLTQEDILTAVNTR